jgi:hypothetical protein
MFGYIARAKLQTCTSWHSARRHISHKKNKIEGRTPTSPCIRDDDMMTKSEAVYLRSVQLGYGRCYLILAGAVTPSKLLKRLAVQLG